MVCLYYLFKNWRQDFGHYIVTAFSLAITLYNIATFVLKSMTITRHLYVLVCGTEYLGTFQLGDLFEQSLKLANVFVPTFLWITDGFLVRSPLIYVDGYRQSRLQLYRTWVIWFQRRTYILFPALVYIASVGKFDVDLPEHELSLNPGSDRRNMARPSHFTRVQLIWIQQSR
jgi:hypothetical protein